MLIKSPRGGVIIITITIIIIIIIIIIITLFESQIILAQHECCTNWGDCKSNKSNQIKCWFLVQSALLGWFRGLPFAKALMH